MKKLLVVILIMFCFAVGYSVAVYTIILTDMRIENIQIFRQAVVIDEETGETEMQMKMAMNYTLYDDSGNSKGLNVEFDLTAQQRTAIKNFIVPFVQAQAVVDDVNPPAWAE
jgi:uncharacterized protein YxeA